MHTGHRYGYLETLTWSSRELAIPFVWSAIVTCAYELGGMTWVAIPTLPMTLVGTSVAFYLGFKNNASYDRMWEARKIWGAIVNASRSWAFGVRDLLGANSPAPNTDLDRVRLEMVHRHVAWLDALRYQLRQVKTWEHRDASSKKYRELAEIAEDREALTSVLEPNLSLPERDAVLALINPAAHLLANQSQRLSELRREGHLDAFAHMKLQSTLDDLMAEQGKAERIKNFPFPRQYATVNSIFATTFTILLPFGLLQPLHDMTSISVWVCIPFTTVVGWVYLTTDKIGDWSENPFEGLPNDIPITQMARAIERDVRQMVGETDLPPARAPHGELLY